MKVFLIGNNIGYSISPKIHNEYYKKNNLDLNYSILDLKEGEIKSFVSRIKNDKEDIKGFNVTKPYKEKIVKFLDYKDQSVNLTGASNTVLYKNKKLYGYNTDIYGFTQSILDNNINLKDKNSLILGSGGGAKAVFQSLKNFDSNIFMAFRDTNKINEFKGVKEFYKLNEIKTTKKFDIIINATTLGNINNDISPVQIEKYNSETILYDLNYVPELSKFLRDGKKRGLRVINGSLMLKLQAMKAIDIWTKTY